MHPAAPALRAHVIVGRSRRDHEDQRLEPLAFQTKVRIRHFLKKLKERLLRDILGAIAQVALQVPLEAILVAPGDLEERLAVPGAESLNELAVAERGSI